MKSATTTTKTNNARLCKSQYESHLTQDSST